MDRQELIQKYIEFFKSKDHKEIKNSSLIPENDPIVLFTTAGMHPLVPFLSGEKHPQGKRLVNVQRCIRTGDIEEVGDTTHHTFFEMLGNWSLGDYWKKEAIEYSFEFLTKILEVPKERLAVTVFAGDENAKRDVETMNVWKNRDVKNRIFLKDNTEDNWWGPAGETGPCGPDTEIFYWKSKKISVPGEFNPNDRNWVEIWNNVFMQYKKTKEEKYLEAKQQNIDTGMGVERTLAILNNLEDNYETEAWKQIIKRIEELSNKKYKDYKKEMRIIADHIKAACFIIHDGITPSNTEQGYVLRRLIRRAIRYSKLLEIPQEKNLTMPLIKEILKIYPEYKLNEKRIIDELNKEENKFEKTLDKGLRELKKMAWKESIDKPISGKDTFLLFQSYGFPIEMIKEIFLSEFEKDINEEDFKRELKKHQELSQTASKGKFKSGLADDSEATTNLHTAAHMLLAALKKVLGKEVEQKGSNINAERLRFDFNFERKLTDEEKNKIEEIVNKEIQKDQKITREEMTLTEAKEKGASGIFDDKYKEKVSVYTIGKFSKEICTGPHVENTKDLGTFKITKEQSSSSGVRRIKATLE